VPESIVFMLVLLLFLADFKFWVLQALKRIHLKDTATDSSIWLLIRVRYKNWIDHNWKAIS